MRFVTPCVPPEHTTIDGRKIDTYIDDVKLMELAAESEELMAKLSMKIGWLE